MQSAVFTAPLLLGLLLLMLGLTQASLSSIRMSLK